MRTGFIGLGNIGGRCARHVLAAGHELTVADLDDAARARLVDAGATAAASAATVVHALVGSPPASRSNDLARIIT